LVGFQFKEKEKETKEVPTTFLTVCWQFYRVKDIGVFSLKFLRVHKTHSQKKSSY